MKNPLVSTIANYHGQDRRRQSGSGMIVVVRGLLFLLSILLVLPACEPTYKKANFRESVKELAQKEYGLSVEVAETGNTLGVQFRVNNLLSEMYSGDDDIYKKMNGLFTILARVALSSDIAPDFIVLDILDESNPNFHLVFTRYVEDIKKSMAEALSYTQSQDRLLQEFMVDGRRVTFDPNEMDLIRLMMMAVDAAPAEPGEPPPPFQLEAVTFPTFISRVIENSLRRILREKSGVKEEIQLRDISASFKPVKNEKGQFKIQLDVVSKSKPSVEKPLRLAPGFLEKNVLPLVASEIGGLFKSYRFHDFSNITVVEKNSGKTLIVPAR